MLLPKQWHSSVFSGILPSILKGIFYSISLDFQCNSSASHLDENWQSTPDSPGIVEWSVMQWMTRWEECVASMTCFTPMKILLQPSSLCLRVGIHGGGVIIFSLHFKVDLPNLHLWKQKCKQ